MKRNFLLGVLTLLLFSGCGDDNSTNPDGESFAFSFDGLPVLGHGRFYEAWISFPEEGSPAPGARHDDDRVSLGKFVMTVDGTAVALDGSPALFTIADGADLEDAVSVFVTVESEGATSPGPTLLAGDVTGNSNQGEATLTIGHHDAVGSDFAGASGGFILATPSDGEGANEAQGIWFTDAAGTPDLSVPPLAAGWIYHAHVFHGGHSLSVGTFGLTSGQDSDGSGPEAGTQAGFAAPGSDFLVSQHDLSDGASTAFIVIEPASDLHQEGDALRHDSSFPVRILETLIPAGAPVRQSIDLARPATALPSVSVVFTR